MASSYWNQAYDRIPTRLQDGWIHFCRKRTHDAEAKRIEQISALATAAINAAGIIFSLSSVNIILGSWLCCITATALINDARYPKIPKTNLPIPLAVRVIPILFSLVGHEIWKKNTCIRLITIIYELAVWKFCRNYQPIIPPVNNSIDLSFLLEGAWREPSSLEGALKLFHFTKEQARDPKIIQKKFLSMAKIFRIRDNVPPLATEFYQMHLTVLRTAYETIKRECCGEPDSSHDGLLALTWEPRTP